MKSITSNLLELLGHQPLQMARDVATCVSGGHIKGTRHTLPLDALLQPLPLVAKLRRRVRRQREVVSEAVALRVEGTCAEGAS